MGKKEKVEEPVFPLIHIDSQRIRSSTGFHSTKKRVISPFMLFLNSDYFSQLLLTADPDHLFHSLAYSKIQEKKKRDILLNWEKNEWFLLLF